MTGTFNKSWYGWMLPGSSAVFVRLLLLGFWSFSDVMLYFGYRGFAAVGVDPAVMGVGPAVAIPAAVKAAGLEVDDIDLFEINEVSHFFSINLGQFIGLVHDKLENIMNIPKSEAKHFPCTLTNMDYGQIILLYYRGFTNLLLEMRTNTPAL